MLLAILQQLQSRYPDATYAMEPNFGGSQPIRKIVGLGMRPKAPVFIKGSPCGSLASAVPKAFRDRLGFVVDHEIDMVLDASGFSYGDQWGIQSTTELLRLTKRWKRQGAKVVLMPQSFGPFSSSAIRRDIKAVAGSVDLIMPRDQHSHVSLLEAAGPMPNIHLYGDFTNLIAAQTSDQLGIPQNASCLVPNHKMLSHASNEERSLYVGFMVRCARRLFALDANPFILIHEGNRDVQLAQLIAAKFDGNLPILTEHNPMRVKGIIGSCTTLIGSRYHALVSALSQGVPCLGTGWSHKYRELFRDYGKPEWLLSADVHDHVLTDKINLLINSTTRQEQSQALLRQSAQLKLKSKEMWELIFRTIET